MAEKQSLEKAVAKNLTVQNNALVKGNLTVLGTITGGTDADVNPATTADLTKLHAATGAALASGTKGAAITAPTGGATVDTQARAAIASLYAALQAYNITS